MSGVKTYSKGDVVRVWNCNGDKEDPAVGSTHTVLGPRRTYLYPEDIREDDPMYLMNDMTWWYASELDMVEKYVSIHDASPMIKFSN